MSDTHVHEVAQKVYLKVGEVAASEGKADVLEISATRS